jgi:hypothetical protein
MCSNTKKKYTKSFFSRTTGPKELKFTRKLSDRVQKRTCENYDPRGSGGAAIGEIVFTCTYKEIIFNRSSQDPMDPKS